MAKKLIITLVILLLVGGGLAAYYFLDYKAAPQVKQGVVVARVGNAVLTVDDIKKRIPPEYSDFVSYDQNVDYVKRWIDGEILLQTALARKIDKDPAVQARLDKMRKDLLTSEMISRLCAQSSDIADSDIEKYYTEHPDQFGRKEIEVKFVHINVKTQPEAWKLRTTVTPDNFMQLAKQYSTDPVEDPETQPYVTRSQVAPELAAVIFDIKINGTTPVIQTPTGFYIVKIVDKQLPGSVRPLKAVREEIMNHLASQTQKVHLDKIIADLRKGIVIESNLNLVPGKTETPASVPDKPAEPQPAATSAAPAAAEEPAAAKAPAAPLGASAPVAKPKRAASPKPAPVAPAEVPQDSQ